MLAAFHGGFMRHLIPVFFVAASLMGCASSEPAAPASNDIEWTAHGRTGDEQRYTPLD
jgi:hypothetical protein